MVDGGRIVERGTHDSLLAAGGGYYDLCMSQFRCKGVEEGEEELATD